VELTRLDSLAKQFETVTLDLPAEVSQRWLDQQMTFEAVPNDGWAFSHWLQDGERVDEDPVKTTTGEVNLLVATFSAQAPAPSPPDDPGAPADPPADPEGGDPSSCPDPPECPPCDSCCPECPPCPEPEPCPPCPECPERPVFKIGLPGSLPGASCFISTVF
jgi:hypothetical protein